MKWWREVGRGEGRSRPASKAEALKRIFGSREMCILSNAQSIHLEEHQGGTYQVLRVEDEDSSFEIMARDAVDPRTGRILQQAGEIVG